MQKFLITGNQRTGTTLMRILMESFNFFIFSEERNPFVPLGLNEKNKPILVRKCPLGQHIAEDKRHLGDFIGLGGSIKTLNDVTKAGWKIIYMIRDGRDVLVSRHGNNMDIYWARPWQYIASHKNSKDIHKNKKILVVKYEDLVLNHESMIPKIEKFMGTKSSNYNQSHKKISPDSQAGRAVRNPRPIDSNSVGAWKKPEHKDRIKEIINDDLCKALIELGYENDDSWTKEYK